jgi:tetratricopeptide (TPR) repeat protein
MNLLIRYVLMMCILFFPLVTNGDGITSISKTNKLLKQGEEAFKKRDFKTAIQAYESAIKESTEVPAQANMNLGSAYFQVKDFTKAQRNYQNAATSLNSPSLKSVAYQQIGNIFSEQKDYKSALDWYKKSLRANPLNESARFNYELAYKLNKKAEEAEKKNNPNKDNKQDKQEKKDQKQDQKQGQDQKKEDKGQEKDQKGKEEEKKGQKPGEQQKGKDQDSKDGKDPKKGDDPNAPETDKESAEGKEKNKEEKDKEGKEESKSKKDESNVDDPNAIRVDKKKLQETGLSEEQAKSLLEAMKQSEVKYLQQRRFKSPKGGSDKNKQRW